MNIYAIILLVTFSRKRKILKKSMTPSVMNQLVNYFLTEKNQLYLYCRGRFQFCGSARVAFSFQLTYLLHLQVK